MSAVEKEMLKYCSVCFEDYKDKEVASDIIVPDSEPDVFDVIATCSQVEVSSVNPVAGRITVAGRIKTKLICKTDVENASVVLEKDFEFEQSFECGDFSNEAVISAPVSVVFLTGKVLNSRKVGVRCQLRIHCLVQENKETEVVVAGEKIQTKCKKITYSRILGSDSKILRIGEDIDIPDGKPCIEELIASTVTVSCTEKKIINNRLVVKGNLKVDSCYLTPNREIEYLQNDIPFNHVFSVDQLTEDDFASISFTVQSVHAETYQNGNGENRVIAVDTTVLAECVGYTSVEKFVCIDVFSTKWNCTYKTESLNLLSLPHIGKGVGDFHEKIAFSATVIGVENIQATPMIETVLRDENAVVMRGEIVLRILARTEANGLKSVEQRVPFEARTDADCGENCQVLQTNATVQGVTYRSASADSVEVTGNVSVLLVYCSSLQVSAITDVECEKEREQNGGFCVYYPSASEPFWEIAKRYGVAVDALLSANDCSGEICNETMVLIPKCE